MTWLAMGAFVIQQDITTAIPSRLSIKDPCEVGRRAEGELRSP